MAIEYEYRDHDITITISEMGARFDWSFQIDGGTPTNNRESGARSYAQAEIEARGAAERSVDEWIRIQKSS